MFLDDMKFGFESRRNEMLKPTINCIAPVIIAAGISAAAGIAGSLMAKDAPEGYEPEVLPKTVSGQVNQDMNFLFDIEAGEAMANLTGQLNEWSTTDREFFDKTFKPFQASLIEANQALIPGIVANSGEAMQSNLKDLMGGDFLKDAFRGQIEKAGADVSKFAESFSQQIDDIPTAEQRIGEAVSGVEQRFGEAGAELKRQMASQGLDVSQASQRELAIEKAKAKAGVTDTAAEAARRERLSGAEAGVGVAAGVQQSQAALLAQQQELTQTGAMLTPQVGGVQAGEALSEAGKVGAELAQTGAEKVLGTGSETQQAEFTQKGVQVPKFFDRETGAVVTASGQNVSDFNTEMQMKQAAFDKAYRLKLAEINYAKSRSPETWGGGPGVGAGGPGGDEGPGTTGGVVGGGTGESGDTGSLGTV